MRLLHLLMPACAAAGSQGLPVPDPVNIALIAAANARNAAMLAPADFQPSPTIAAQACPVPAETLYSTLLRIALAQPRTFLAAAYPTRLQAHFVARSERLNVPSVIVVQATALDSQASFPLIYAASVYGPADFGVNRRRLLAWSAALNDALKPPSS